MLHAFQRLRHRIVWLVAAMFVLGSVAPSLTTFVGKHSGLTWAEVCTTEGTKLVALESDSDSDQHNTYPGVHCPYCRIQQDIPAVAHAPGVVVSADGTVRGVPLLTEPIHPLPAAIWLAHRSRAPPSFS